MAALTNQSRKALRRIPLIAPNSVHFCPISEPNHLQYQKIRVGIRSPGASNLGGEPVTVQKGKKWRARGKKKCEKERVGEQEQREEQNVMNYRKRQKRPGLAS